jgi:hypothetical protein
MHAQQRNGPPKGAAIADTTNVKEPLLVDLKSASSMISSPVSTVRRLIRQKQLKYILLGKKFLIDPADIRNLISQSKIGGSV